MRFQKIESMKEKPTEDEARNMAIELDCEVSTLFPGGYESFVQHASKINRQVILNTDKIIHQNDAKMLVGKMLENTNMPEKEKFVIDYRYGLSDGVPHTLEEVGEKMGVSKDRIRQMEAKAHERIRNTKLNAQIIKLSV